MVVLACLLVFLSITLLIGAFGTRITLAPRRAAVNRLRDLRPTTYAETLAAIPAAGGAPAGPWWARLLRSSKGKASELTVVSLKSESIAGRLLMHAGYRSRSAERNFMLARFTGMIALGGGGMIAASRSAATPQIAVLLSGFLAALGLLLPKLVVRIQARKRQHRLRLSLPDALDLLVVCVEAGMGLNQAIVRVSEELRETHPMIADEFRIVNLEIRAGRTRGEALRSLGERTGVDDIASLAAMIIQTDKFGTSIAKSLRVHSDCLRTERRQRAEEAAAKTTIKLIFPLLFCIFPALFVTILGPAALHLAEIFNGEVPR
ncbi:MAG TPA: type II secretion system F family protein [Candidatus Polarisedimenticolia bacterium]|nr:type II secretion system F family protein [Candidatus Polarisedimenticolia bacterium]